MELVLEVVVREEDEDGGIIDGVGDTTLLLVSRTLLSVFCNNIMV